MTISHPTYDHTYDLLIKEHKTRTCDVLLSKEGTGTEGTCETYMFQCGAELSYTEQDYKELNASGCRLQNKDVDNNGCVPKVWTLRS